MKRLIQVVAALLLAGQAAGEPGMDAEELVKALGLEPHVEGGYFRRTFQADHRERISIEQGERFTMTSIYYLLTADSRVGHWHLNRSDILHFFHLGEPVTYYLIHPDGELETVVLGPDPSQGHQLQLAVKGGTWKASHLAEGDYGLISEAVSPGFEYEDMTLGEEVGLLETFPDHAALIRRFSKH
ncbi:MAG: cupin domain-containing protein [Halieaceae bacterium]|nr:cupin domain-containing protein [Halieaceae bacterium]